MEQTEAEAECVISSSLCQYTLTRPELQGHVVKLIFDTRPREFTLVPSCSSCPK